MSDLYIGLMSGTSMDGVDAALCRIGAAGQWLGVIGHAHRPFDATLRAALMALQSSGPDELHRAALAANALARVYAAAVADLLKATGTPPSQIQAVGAHGQTVRHQPGLHDGIGYTCQINQPALLAEWCGIAVVADFRSRDVIAGGQGAPLVPPFHAAVFGSPEVPRAVVNIGGISNLTVLTPDQPPRGWDCGPGNVLLDLWIARHRGLAYDADGAWGASGRVDTALLQALLAEPYLQRTPPKSTGRDLFHADWLDTHLRQMAPDAAPQDVQATLCELTARAIANDLRDQAGGARQLLVCGGGALNLDLMRRLQQLLPSVRVASSVTAGLPPLQVEAAAFAWLAAMHCQRRAASVPAVTGARGPRVLGAFYPA